MTCPFGTSSVSVGASNNGIGFTATTDLDITVTDFSTSVNPGGASLSPGRSASFVVTVAPSGGAYSTPIGLSCNTGTLPPGVSCTFTPDTVTPGNAPARSVLTLSTTASSFAPMAGAREPDDAPSGQPVSLPAVIFVSVLAAAAILQTVPRRADSVRRLIAVAACASRRSVTRSCACRLHLHRRSRCFRTLTFGSQTVATSAPAQLVQITNTGADPMTLTVSVSGDFSFVTTCGSTVASGAERARSRSRLRRLDRAPDPGP